MVFEAAQLNLAPERPFAMTTRILALIAAVMLFAPHAQAAQEEKKGNPIGRYLKARAADLADIFRARVAIPEDPASFAFKARATSLVQAGAVRFDGRMAGMDQREAGVWNQTRKEVGASLLYFSSVQSDPDAPECCPTGIEEHDPAYLHYNGWDDGRNRPFSFGLMFQPFFLPGVDLGLYPSEAVDFATGLVGLDMFGDDKPARAAANIKPVMPGEALMDSRAAFVFDAEFDEALAPYVFEASPAKEELE